MSRTQYYCANSLDGYMPRRTTRSSGSADITARSRADGVEPVEVAHERVER